MTCSLLFTGSTVGSVVGTILLERIVNFLGQFYPSLNHCTYLPPVPFFDRLFTKDVSAALPCGVGYSPAKARFSSLVLGGLLHPLFFIIMGTARNYPSLLLAYAIAAFARSFWTGEHFCRNFYVVSTPKKPLGVLLGCWCIGSFSAPLVCQTLMAKGIPWKHFYLGSLVISVIALSLTVYSFRPTRNEFLADCNAALDAMRITPSAHSPRTDTMIQPSHEEKVRDSSARRVDARCPPNTLLLALSMPYQWAFSLFAFIYSGSETTFQGFIVTYLLTNRGSSPDTVGYVSSGFWGGMAAGRILWGYYCTGLTFTQRKHIIHACTGVAFLMTILIWFVNSTIENALSSAVVGLMYGPIFPGTLGLCNDVLPRDVHMVSMAILTAVASAGSAVLPFMTGIISNMDGMRVFCYVTVSQTVAMFVLWLFFPSSPPVRVLSPA
ncbi:MFS general substrate transporter [Suillus brevipes Sb2]|nr:MFS general substrate transporter [Suillus brevipes Sb2]